jgi:hypothetical protein
MRLREMLCLRAISRRPIRSLQDVQHNLSLELEVEPPVLRLGLLSYKPARLVQSRAVYLSNCRGPLQGGPNHVIEIMHLLTDADHNGVTTLAQADLYGCVIVTPQVRSSLTIPKKNATLVRVRVNAPGLEAYKFEGWTKVENVAVSPPASETEYGELSQYHHGTLMLAGVPNAQRTALTVVSLNTSTPSPRPPKREKL